MFKLVPKTSNEPSLGFDILLILFLVSEAGGKDLSKTSEYPVGLGLEAGIHAMNWKQDCASDPSHIAKINIYDLSSGQMQVGSILTKHVNPGLHVNNKNDSQC